MKRIGIIILILMFLIGCSSQTQVKDKSVGEINQPSSEQSSSVPEMGSEETPSEQKAEVRTPSEPMNSNTNTNNNPDVRKSVSTETNQAKPKAAQPSNTPPKTGTQVLGATDPNVPYEALNDMWFSFEAPKTYSVHPKKNLTIRWNHQAPNFLLRVRDMSDVNMNDIFIAYVGNVNSYTIPGTLLTEGRRYGISLYATSGTDSSDPNYKRVSSTNSEQVLYGRSVTIHTLTPPKVTLPQNNSEIIKGDTIVKWEKTDWFDKNGRPIVGYEIQVSDLTDKTPIYYESTFEDNILLKDSILIPGHRYEVKVTASINPYDYSETAIADNTKSTIITFSIR